MDGPLFREEDFIRQTKDDASDPVQAAEQQSAKPYVECGVAGSMESPSTRSQILSGRHMHSNTLNLNVSIECALIIFLLLGD